MANRRAAPNAGHFYSNIVEPVKVDIQFTVSAADSGGYGVTSIKSNGYVQNVYMHTSQTAAAGSPNPAAGQGLIILKNNFNKYLGCEFKIESPVTGSAIAINGGGLTVSAPYQITTVGSVPQPTFTVTAVADSGGSLASTYWTFTDQLSNNYVVYYIVSGVGSAPSLTGALANYTAIPVSIATNDTNSTVAGNTRTALAAASNVTITGSSQHVIVTGAASNSNLQFAQLPSAGTSGFTVGSITFTSLATDWQSVGFPKGFSPTVGAAFYATSTGSAVNTTARVKALGISGVSSLEIMGVTNQLISNSDVASNAGAQVLFQFLAATNSSTTTLIPTNPTDTSVVSMSLYFDNSSVTVDGL